MKQNLLICLTDSGLQESLLQKGEALGFKVQGIPDLPAAEQLGSLLPDVLLLDMDWLAEAGLYYLETISENFPSINVLILADSRYQEEELFLTLRSGARGWLFKQEPEKILGEVKEMVERGYFLTAVSAAFVLEDFKNFTSGEPLLPVEEEILRKCASGLTIPQILKSLNLSKKFLKSHWESIWQKLNINSRAKAEVENQPAPAGAESQEQQKVQPVSAAAPPAAPAVQQPEKQHVIELPPDVAEELLPAAWEQKPAPSTKPAPSAAEEAREKSFQGSFQLVTFLIGDEEFALPITQLQEVQRMLPITHIPRLPQFVEGIVNLRGKIVPILDLRKRLGLEVKPLSKDARIMVVSVADKTIGMIVDRVQEVLRIESASVEPPPPLVLSMEVDYIHGVVNIADRLVLLLNADRVIHYEEKSGVVG